MVHKKINHSVPKPAYVSFRTFSNFLRRFKATDTGLPAQIDRSVLGGMSGSNQSALLGALEFLRLTDANGHVTGWLKDLVEAVDDENEWRKCLARVFNEAYSPILGSVDLGSATGNMVRAAFKENGGVDGHTATKAIGFCLKLAKESAITVSPHIKVSLPGQPKVTRKKSKKTSRKPPSNSDEGKGASDSKKLVPPTPEGLTSIVVAYPGIGEGIVQLPADFTEAHVDYVSAVLKGYVTLRDGGDGN